MKDEAFATCFGMIVSTILLIVAGTLVDGWALAKIWNWFMPTVFGLVSLTMWKAIGISMVFQLFTRTDHIESGSKSSDTKSFGEIFVQSLVKVVLTPLFSVFIAWIVVQFAF